MRNLITSRTVSESESLEGELVIVIVSMNCLVSEMVT